MPNNKAAIPATKGVDIDVPDIFTYGSLRFDNFSPGKYDASVLSEIIFTPGATTSGFASLPRAGPRLEKSAITSSRMLTVRLSSIAPTVTADGLIPGVVIVARSGPEFPAAIATNIPSFHSLSTAATKGSFLKDPVARPPSERETTFILNSFLLSKTHCIPAAMSDACPCPPLSITFIPIMCAKGATPACFPSDKKPFPATAPAMNVPCPLSS